VRDETQKVAGWAFEKVLALLHPFIPFITEQLWQQLVAAESGHFLMLRSWPAYDRWAVDADAKRKIDRMVNVVGAIRTARTMNKLSPKVQLKAFARGVPADVLDDLRSEIALLKAVAGIEELNAREKPAGVGEALAVVDGGEFILPLDGVVDLGAEKARLEREMAKQEQELEKLNGLLGNPNFTARAPAEVLETNRARASELAENVAKLKAMLSA
jgi:valyl-tRNA synthetase